MLRLIYDAIVFWPKHFFFIIPPTFPLAHTLQTCYPFGRPTAGAFPAEREGGSMVAGHLQEKNGYFYAVLSYKDSSNKRKTKWIPTGYPVRGNKKKAEAFLTEQRKAFEIPEEDASSAAPDELFADYLERWLQIAKGTIAITTYSSYEGMLRYPLLPWFREKGVTLKGLTARHIQDFYSAQMKRVKPNTVIHYHAVIHRALKYAVKTDLIDVNPADKVDRPRKNGFQPGFYEKDEMNHLFDCVSGLLIEAPVKLAAFYGLRRSEVLGLKWDAIDFDSGTITIQHTVTGCNVDGRYTIVARDTTKTKSSRRTLPLTPPIRELLLQLRAEQAENRRLCGDSYIRGYEGYICINEVGARIRPEYLSSHFEQVLEKNGLRRIRFHDLRHSSASLLLANHVPLKQIQEWLGHSDFSTTANIYAHLDAQSKSSTADAMLRGLGFTSPEDSSPE